MKWMHVIFPPWKMVIIDTCLKYGINIRLKDIYFAVKLFEIEREIVVVEKKIFFSSQRRFIRKLKIRDS